MRIKAVYNLAGACIITAACVFGLSACNDSSDPKTSETAPVSPDSAANASKMAATDTAANASKMTTSTTTTTKKKRKASITMPNGSSEKMIKDKEGVYNYAEVMPEYPGGQDALASFVNDQLQNSQGWVDDNTTSTVRVSFVIDENGKVTNARLIDGGKVGNGLDKEVVKAVNNMPTWKPGKVKGKNVKTRLELPISFQEA
jgi:protein TonB